MDDNFAKTYRSRLIIEIIAEKLQFDRLSRRLPGTGIYPPYLLVGIGLFIEYGFFDVYNYFVSGQSSFISQPNSLAIPVMTVVGIVSLRYINDGYANAVSELGIEDEHTDIRDDVHEKFKGLVSLRTRLVAYIIALISFYLFAVFVIGYSNLIEISGIGLVLYAQIVSFPLIIIPTLVELALSYVAIQILIPRRLARADLDLFFYDPRNLGGFAPIGQLLKRSYYIYTGILLLWFFQTHAPVILDEFMTSPYPAPGPIYQVALSGLWVVGVLSIGYAMYRVHTIMKQKKEDRIRELEAEIKAAVRDPYDTHPENIKNQERYDKAQEALSQVQTTKTYPTTFAMWSQIFISVLLPQALNIVVSLPG